MERRISPRLTDLNQLTMAQPGDDGWPLFDEDFLRHPSDLRLHAAAAASNRKRTCVQAVAGGIR